MTLANGSSQTTPSITGRVKHTPQGTTHCVQTLFITIIALSSYGRSSCLCGYLISPTQTSIYKSYLSFFKIKIANITVLFFLQRYSILPGDPGISVTTPTITTPSKVITVQETHSTSLSCKADGLPLPDLTWVRLYGSLPGGRHVIHSNGTLVISGILQQDAGMYVCQAKNVLGMAKSTNLLIVHGMSNGIALVQHSFPDSF